MRCDPRDLDRYGRVVAICFKGSEDLNCCIVANGWAVAFRRYSLDYVADEAAARRSQINYLVRRLRHAVGLARAAP